MKKTAVSGVLAVLFFIPLAIAYDVPDDAGTASQVEFANGVFLAPDVFTNYNLDVTLSDSGTSITTSGFQGDDTYFAFYPAQTDSLSLDIEELPPGSTAAYVFLRDDSGEEILSYIQSGDNVVAVECFGGHAAASVTDAMATGRMWLNVTFEYSGTQMTDLTYTFTSSDGADTGTDSCNINDAGTVSTPENVAQVYNTGPGGLNDGGAIYHNIFINGTAAPGGPAGLDAEVIQEGGGAEDAVIRLSFPVAPDDSLGDYDYHIVYNGQNLDQVDAANVTEAVVVYDFSPGNVDEQGNIAIQPIQVSVAGGFADPSCLVSVGTGTLSSGDACGDPVVGSSVPSAPPYLEGEVVTAGGPGVDAVVELGFLLSSDDPSPSGAYDYRVYFDGQVVDDFLIGTLTAGNASDGEGFITIEPGTLTGFYDFYVKAFNTTSTGLSAESPRISLDLSTVGYTDSAGSGSTSQTGGGASGPPRSEFLGDADQLAENIGTTPAGVAVIQTGVFMIIPAGLLAAFPIAIASETKRAPDFMMVLGLGFLGAIFGLILAFAFGVAPTWLFAMAALAMISTVILFFRGKSGGSTA